MLGSKTTRFSGGTRAAYHVYKSTTRFIDLPDPFFRSLRRYKKDVRKAVTFEHRPVMKVIFG